jgi:Carboxypeptidase regulatory-like domain/TonB-dependent Receptor Plug Domain/TonB dependent receptor
MADRKLKGRVTVRAGISDSIAVFLITFASLAPVMLTSIRTYAQVAGAMLSGVVKDPSGAAIPNVTVSLKNSATGATRTAATDVAGFYSMPNMLPGKYDITASATGFSTRVETGLTLEVGASQVLDLSLQVGQVTETVQVADSVSAVQLETSAISAVLNSITVRELPLNGRSWTDLATLQPGVISAQTHASQDVNRGYGSQVSISGSRPQQNNYRLDGVSLNDYANGGPGSVLGGNLGVDAIQEFSVLTTNPSAEYGKSSGGVVNAVTRSGTNQFHGSVYEFLRNSALDARNFFDTTIPPFKRNQFGATAGGPIRKDRTFVFADYEGIRQSLGVTSFNTVLSPAARGGQLCSVPGTPPACTPTTVTVVPGAQEYLRLLALPNGPLLGNGDLGVFTVQQQQITSENFFTGRVDHRFSERDSFSGTYMFDKTPQTQPDSYNVVLASYLTKRQTLVLEETHVFRPDLVNSVRFGYTRDLNNGQQTSTAINPAAADLSLGAVPGHAAAKISVPGLATFGGVGAQDNFLYRWNSFQGYDDAFLSKGLHSLKFGAAVEREQLNELAIADPNGAFSFGSLSDFLTGIPQVFTAAFPNLLSERGLRQTILGLYVQDDWRWRPNLTLNIGLRYEMATVPTEVNGKLSNLYNLTDSVPHLGNPYFSNPTRRNFEPRVGFAWDPRSDGKTVVHGAFGEYDSLPLPYMFVTLIGRPAPFTKIGLATNLPAGSFPGGAFSLLGPSSLEYGYVEHNPKRNYVMQWNINVQRALAPDLTAIIAYVGSRGVHQPFRTDDANVVIPTGTASGYLWPTPIGSGTVLNPNAGAIRFLNWRGDSYYDALELGITKKMSHGLQIQGSYTWGKSIDTSSGVIAGDTLANAISSPLWFNLRMNRAPSDFNVGRNFVLSETWRLPRMHFRSEPLAWAANGWELGTIFKASDGVPFTATFGTDGSPLGLNSSDPWDVPNRLTGPGCGSLINPGNPTNYIKTQCFAIPSAPSQAFWQANCDPNPPGVPAPGAVFPECFNLRGNAGRNILTGPGLLDLDFSAFKNNPIARISETFNVQFRAEFFNILNRTNFAAPSSPSNTDIFDSAGAPNGAAGLLSSTTTTSRQIQFAIKVIW